MFTLTSLSPLSPEATTLGKRVDKVQVPVRYCMLGSRDSARSVAPAGPGFPGAFGWFGHRGKDLAGPQEAVGLGRA